MSFGKALVIGAGAFGTSIASILSKNFSDVVLKVRSKDVYDGIKEKHENLVYLPGIKLDSNIIPALSWDEVDEIVDGSVDLVVSGLPTAAIKNYFEENFSRVVKYLNEDVPFVSLSKGIDADTLELPDDLLLHHFSDFHDQLCYLSGPSFAKEILEKQITLVSLAGRSRKLLIDAATMFETDYFRIIPTYDVKGVLLGGALKNILAIAGGIIEGLGFNHNTRAAMITRGISEMLRFGKILNARPETFYGLSGMGDLILTTTGALSRNKSFGLEIAKGRSPKEIIDSQRTVVEGYKTAKAAYRLSERYHIRANIFNGLYSVLYENVEPRETIKRVMKMAPSSEVE